MYLYLEKNNVKYCIFGGKTAILVYIHIYLYYLYIAVFFHQI